MPIVGGLAFASLSIAIQTASRMPTFDLAAERHTAATCALFVVRASSRTRISVISGHAPAADVVCVSPVR